MGLKQRVDARDRLVAQAELLGLQLHDDLLGALARGDLLEAENTARRNDAQLRALTENLRVYQAELRAQADELALSQARTEAVLERFSALFGAMPVAALLVAGNGEVLEHNREAARLFGLERRLASARFLHRLIDGSDYQDRVTPALHEAGDAGASRVDGIAFVGPDGRRFVGELHVARLPNAEAAAPMLRGEGAFVIAVVDRSEHLATLGQLQSAATALRSSEAFLADSARLARVGGWELRPRAAEGSGWRWSRELRQILELPADAEASLEALLALAAPHDRPLLASALALAERGEPFEIELDMLGAGGRVMRVRGVGHADRDTDGTVARVSGVFQDVSAQDLARRRIGDLSERLSMAHEAGGIGVFDWDLDTGTVVLDARLVALLRGTGAPAAAEADGGLRVAGGLVAALAGRVDADSAALLEAALQRTVHAFEPLNLELRLEGEGDRWLHLTGRAQAGAEGHTARLVGCAWDSSPEHAAARLTAAKEAAESASRAKSAFLSRMSHELRTPLNAILGFAQLMRMEAEGGDLVLKPHRVALIETAARHLLDLVNEVLDVSRIEAGRVDVQLAPLDLREVVGESVPLVQALARSAGIGLADGLAGGPPVMVLADRLRLKEVLINLLSNAIKYNRPAGRVTIDVAAEGGEVRLSVHDTGRGLTPAQLDELFQPFSRAGAEATGIEGSGMGLFVSRRFVELMGGRIEVSSEVGQGTTVVVRLHAPA